MDTGKKEADHVFAPLGSGEKCSLETSTCTHLYLTHFYLFREDLIYSRYTVPLV